METCHRDEKQDKMVTRARVRVRVWLPPQSWDFYLPAKFPFKIPGHMKLRRQMVNDEVLHQNSMGYQGCENFAALGPWPREEGPRGKGLSFGWGTSGIYWHNTGLEDSN